MAVDRRGVSERLRADRIQVLKLARDLATDEKSYRFTELARGLDGKLDITVLAESMWQWVGAIEPANMQMQFLEDASDRETNVRHIDGT